MLLGRNVLRYNGLDTVHVANPDRREGNRYTPFILPQTSDSPVKFLSREETRDFKANRGRIKRSKAPEVGAIEHSEFQPMASAIVTTTEDVRIRPGGSVGVKTRLINKEGLAILPLAPNKGLYAKETCNWESRETRA